MPKFKLVKKHFCKKDQEWQWTYQCSSEFTFKKREINHITITDHYQQNHPELTNELILNIFNHELNGLVRMRPVKKINGRDIYVREWVAYEDKDYLLVFWFKDNSDNHLWIRNCYPVG